LDPRGEKEDPPFSSKRSYVRRRLSQKSLSELADLARRINEEYETPGLTHLIALTGARGVNGQFQNLIFAANGPKPTIVLADALNNTIEITQNAEYCMVYDRPLEVSGLSWSQLVEWWRSQENSNATEERELALRLYARLRASLQRNVVEELLFDTYAGLYRTIGFNIPALIPQVYLHYDPYTRRGGATLSRQRMDFLLLMPGRRRIVLEVDGAQHYSANSLPRPDLYAQMVAEDRKLRLAGYEVYRFGGKELTAPDAKPMLEEFFSQLLAIEQTS
jgi:very-short-patch-repair endonuclease